MQLFDRDAMARRNFLAKSFERTQRRRMQTLACLPSSTWPVPKDFERDPQTSLPVVVKYDQGKFAFQNYIREWRARMIHVVSIWEGIASN